MPNGPIHLRIRVQPIGGGSLAAGELERNEPRVPVEAAIVWKVLVRIPEGAVIDWIDGHAGVVSPAAQATVL